ncbi:MAG: hypothetical protein HY934_01550 [Candidatus Firestonebacteria bacterium]|nr:hypothetical protein [Candidatus Firestonebacteria bacterium]
MTDNSEDGITDLFEIDLNDDNIYDLAYKYYSSNGIIINLYEKSDEYVQEGINYLNRNIINLAEDDFMKSQEIFYNNEDSHFYLGELLLLYKKDFVSALEKYRTVYKIDNSYLKAIERIKQLNMILYLKRKLDKNPEVIDDRIKLGEIYWEIPLLDEAILEYQRIRRLQPNNYLIHCYLGDLYKEKDIIEKAEIEYKQAIDCLPEHPYAYQALGDLYKRKGIKNDGKNEFNKAIEIEKQINVKLNKPSWDISEFYNDISKKYFEIGDLEKATLRVQESLENRKDNYKAYYTMGLINIKKNNNKEAEKSFKMCLDINPLYEKALMAIGKLYYSEKNYKEAFPLFQKAVLVNPYNSEYYLYLGIIYKELGVEDQAKEALLKSLELDPVGENVKIIKRYLIDLKK